VDLISLSKLPLVAAGILVFLILVWGRSHYQRCPHCRRIVPRAHRGWLRCRGCGRQYHRSVHLKR
jgi:hypothetical protein